MSKTSIEDLIEGVKNGIFTYFRAGQLNPKILAKKLINPEIGKIEDFEKILRIHFLLQDHIVEFITNLNKNIRKIKKRAQNRFLLKRDQIKGRVLWQRTVLLRNTKFYGDNSIFICNDPQMNFNIIENIILKKILSIIYTIFKKDLIEFEASNYKYDWFKKWKGKTNNIRQFLVFYKKNIYLKKIKTVELQDITDKQIFKVMKSRSKLYREAANILCEYKKIISNSFDKHFLSKLLNSTLIAPSDISTLYELYCIFKIVFKIQENLDMKLNLISKINREFAIFENNNYYIYIYHDSTGSFNFYEKIPELNRDEIKNQYLRRLVISRKEHLRIIQNIMKSKPKPHLYSGRPDIIIEMWRKKPDRAKILERIYIGEIKYTISKNYFSQGLKELIEYIQFAKFNNSYLVNKTHSSKEIDDNLKIYGILIADGTNFLKEEHKVLLLEKIDLLIFNTGSIDKLAFEFIDSIKLPLSSI